MIPPMEHQYAQNWKAATVPILDPGANTTYIAIVTIKNPTRTDPYLESSTFTFWLGRQENRHEAEKTFESLGFTLPNTAHVVIEERK